jgi:hypothetical protein
MTSFVLLYGFLIGLQRWIGKMYLPLERAPGCVFHFSLLSHNPDLWNTEGWPYYCKEDIYFWTNLNQGLLLLLSSCSPTFSFALIRILNELIMSQNSSKWVSSGGDKPTNPFPGEEDSIFNALTRLIVVVINPHSLSHLMPSLHKLSDVEKLRKVCVERRNERRAWRHFSSMSTMFLLLVLLGRPWCLYRAWHPWHCPEPTSPTIGSVIPAPWWRYRQPHGAGRAATLRTGRNCRYVCNDSEIRNMYD